MTSRPAPAAFLRSLLFWQYVLLTVLFLRTIWGMWDVRDITSGDTSSYYSTALEFFHDLTCDIAWSPLYTSFLGAFHWINPDPFFVIIAHRIVILAILTVLIFEVGRRLLHPMVAWFITAWWLALPINFNALYEVHLFAVLPALLFWLLLSLDASLRVRGICVGLLFLSVCLVRNEMLVTLGIFGAASVGYDLWRVFRGEDRFQPLRYLAAYGIPVLVACLCIGIVYWRSTDKFPRLSGALQVKHTLNVSQIYAFGYSQRHPEYTDSPWTDYQALMLRDFGNDLPTMREAFFKNPKAMMEHFLWNARLIPSGLQVALFNCRSGDFNPDYAGTTANKPVAITLSILYLAAVAVALFLVARNFSFWREWLARRAWLIFAIAAVCVTVAVVMVMQRPRPSYMFSQTLALMWLGGFSLQAITFHAGLRGRLWRNVAVGLAVAAAVFIPRYYVEARTVELKSANAKSDAGKPKKKLRPPRNEGTRPLLGLLRLLQPHRDEILRGEVRVGTAGFPFELTSYLGLRGKIPQESMVDTVPLLAASAPGETFDALLRKHGLGMVAIPYYQQRKPQVREFMENAPSFGWRLEKEEIAPRDDRESYRLYVADSLAKPAPAP